VIRGIIRLALLLALCCGQLWAADERALAAAQPSGQGNAAVEKQSAARVQAQRISDLIDSKLDGAVDARALFETSLTGAAGIRTRFVLQMLADRSQFERAARDPAVLAGLSADEATLAVAQARFLRLSQSRRERLLADHRARQEKVAAAVADRARKADLLTALEARRAGLQAFLAGNPAPAKSLTFDLLETDENATKGAADSGVEADVYSSSLAQVRAEIGRLRKQILALPDSQRNRLSEIQASSTAAQSSSAAALAGAEQQFASAQAKAAGNGADSQKRLRARREQLAQIRKVLDDYARALARQGEANSTIGESAQSWRSQASDVVARPMSDPGRDLAADQLYLRLIDALHDVRRDLAEALSSPTALVGGVPAVPANDAALPDDPETKKLFRLRAQLAAQATQLQARADAIGWDRRSALYSAMIAMNATRLDLIGALSRPMRAKVTGFDEEGWAQVQREFNQIVLTVRYNVAYAVSRWRSVGDVLTQPNSSQIFGLVQLLIASLVFRLWRGKGDAALESIERTQTSRRPATIASTAIGFGVGILRKARRPLDWLLFLLLLAWVYPSIISLSGVRIIWLIGCWVLVGATLVLVIDAFVQGQQRDDTRAMLRRKSLRLVLGAVVGVGLVLSLTNASVGTGAIYSWVLTLCWLLIVPVVLLLGNWWRERIDALAELGASRSAILAWSARHKDGIAGSLGRIAAGTSLLVQGTRSVAARRLNQLALIRDIAGQRTRAMAAARVMADEASGRYKPISLAQAKRLVPHGAPHTETILSTSAESALAGLTNGQIGAVIGERGLGKTTVLDRLQSKTVDVRKYKITCGTGGFAGIIDALANQLGCAATTASVAAMLGEVPSSIVIDDVQRLIVPAIGGLREFEELVAFARTSGANARWVLAIGGPAWSYLSRAREDRAMFDQVTILPRWSVADIRGLIERRTEQAGLAPRFDLDVHNAGTMLFDGDITPEERVRRQFYEGLTEDSSGNPAVALEFWRRSLFYDQTMGVVAVRTYKAPDLQSLLSLPTASLFVLRAILQMEVALLRAIVDSTDLAAVIVEESIRVLRALGVIVDVEQGYRLTLFWYQDVRRLLERQNLIVRSAL